MRILLSAHKSVWQSVFGCSKFFFVSSRLVWFGLVYLIYVCGVVAVSVIVWVSFWFEIRMSVDTEFMYPVYLYVYSMLLHETTQIYCTISSKRFRIDNFFFCRKRVIAQKWKWHGSRNKNGEKIASGADEEKSRDSIIEWITLYYQSFIYVCTYYGTH